MIDLTPEEKTLKRRMTRAFLRLMIRWHMISLVNGELVYPPLPLKGGALWAFRAWMYLPFPVTFICLFLFLPLHGSDTGKWGTCVVASLVLFAILFLAYRFDRKNPLRMPTLGEILGLTLICIISSFTAFFGHLLNTGHISAGYLVPFLFVPVFVVICLPFSVIIADEHKQNKAKRSRVKT